VTAAEAGQRPAMTGIQQITFITCRKASSLTVIATAAAPVGLSSQLLSLEVFYELLAFSVSSTLRSVQCVTN